MNYELCKKLKDAGYIVKKPQRYGDGTIMTIAKNESSEAYLIPTLEELIEACGEDFFSLINYNGLFQATGGSGNVSGQGSTPTVAMANLWLVLNKN